MTVEEAFAKAEEQLSHCIYLCETSTKPGIAKINSNKAEWLSVILFYAKKGLRDQQKPKWIPVTERLPEEGKWVLCLKNGRWHWLAIWNRPEWTDGEFWEDETVVTHWMPLPEPPKEG